MHWVDCDNLYHIAFDMSAFKLIPYLSGIVDILEVVWDSDEQLMSFVVRGKIPSVLDGGVIISQPLRRYRRTQLGKLFLEPVTRCSACQAARQLDHGFQ